MMSLAVGVNTAGDSPLRWLPGHFSPYLLRAFECGAREAVGGQTSDGTAVKLLSGHASPLQRHRRDAPAEATDPSQGTRRPGGRWVSLRGATPTRTLSKRRSRWCTALSLTGCRARPCGVSTWSLGRWWFCRRPPNMVHCGGWRGTGLLLLVGDDWAEDHHDVEVQAESGRVLGKAKLPEGIAGIARLHALIGGQVGEDDESVQVVVGIETERGPWVQALVAAVKVLTWAHKTLIWERTRHTLRLRRTLLDFFPAAVVAFDDLTAPDALELLGKASDPAAAA